MKILLTSDWYHPIVNGVVMSVLNLKKELEEMGHDVRILTLASSYQSYHRDDVYYIKSVPLYVYPNTRFTVGPSFTVQEEMRAWMPDIVHSNCEFFTFQYAKEIAAKFQIPLIHTYHTIYEHYTAYIKGAQQISSALIPVFSKQRLKSCSAIIAPTSKVKDTLRGYEIKNRIEVIPTGLDLSRFSDRLSDEKRRAMRREWNIPEDAFLLVNLGRMAQEKNIHELFNYVSHMVSDHPNLYFLLVGDGPYRDKLEEIGEELGIASRLRFTGMVPPDTTVHYYQMADLFVSASVSETQGLTYIEALASAKPLLVRRDQCLVDVLEEGKNGYFFDDYDGFAHTLVQIMEQSDLLAALSDYAEKCSIQFSKEIFAKRVLALYEECIDNYVDNEGFRRHLIKISGKALAVPKKYLKRE